MTSPLVSISGLEKRFDLSGSLLEQITFEGGRFRRKQEAVHAINGVDLEVQKGEALCVVGESGCGKSTVARTVMGLLSPSAGEIHYDGQRIDNLERKDSLPYRRKMQMIFQNPYASLNPRMTIQQTLEEPIRFHHPDWSPVQVRDKIHEVMLEPDPQPMMTSYDYSATPLDVMVPIALRSLCFVLSLRALYQWLVRSYLNQQGKER